MDSNNIGSIENVPTLYPSEDKLLANAECQQKEADRNELLSFIDQIHQRLKEKSESSASNTNLSQKRPDETYLSRLDSSVKKNTAFVRKLKHFTSSQMSSLVADLKTINLSKYVSEVAAAIVDAKLKVSDVESAIQLCSNLHQTYADFATHLFSNWQRVLTIKKDDKTHNPSKLRVDLRFFAECITCGIFTNREGLPTLGNILTRLTNYDKEDHNNVNILLNFCRHCGHDFADLVPLKINRLSKQFNIPVPKSNLLPEERQKNLRFLIKDYYKSICKHLLQVNHKVIIFKQQDKKILQTHEELSAERKLAWEELTATLLRLKLGVQNFADILAEVPPYLPEDATQEEDGNLKVVGLSEWDDSLTCAADVWEDEEMQRFYEELPDVKAYGEKKPTTVEPLTFPLADEDKEEEFEPDEPCLDLSDPDLREDSEDPEEDESPTKHNRKQLRDKYFTSLPQCVNRDLIDRAAVDFLERFNTKANRKQLTGVLFGVPRTRLDLLPFYARYVATLKPVAPDVATDLANMLKQDFKYHVRKKDQLKLESKIKTVRFISELVKFNVYSKIEALYCVKVLLQDFSHHHVEMCCHLLEGCGRFLYRHAGSFERTEAYLEQLMRKKAAMALDSRYVTMIENAYYYVNPPTLKQSVAKQRPPIHSFIRHLLYHDLMASDADNVTELLAKLDWYDDKTAWYAVKCLTNAYAAKFLSIRHLAKVVNGLVAHQSFVGVQVVDGVLEDIRLSLEENIPADNQRRIAMVKYLGELYNYCLVDNTVVFNVLYLLVSFGADAASLLDPPDSLIRIRLICVLLDTSGRYFRAGLARKKLEYFVTFFQNYYWTKRADPYWSCNKFPFAVESMYRDSIERLMPELRLVDGYEQSRRALNELREKLASEKPEVYRATRSGEVMETIEEADEESDDDTLTEEIVESEKRTESREDLDFQTALDRMVSENIRERVGDRLKPVEIPVPLHIKEIARKMESTNRTACMNFVLMTKKGNKLQYKSLTVPLDSHLAVNLRLTEEEEKRERERVKRLTLDINERLEEEEYQELLEREEREKTAEMERRRKQHHPKGCPNIELVFASRGSRF